LIQRKISTLLDKKMEKARKPAALPADIGELRETCDLILKYHISNDHEDRDRLGVARFPKLDDESLHKLAAVCAEYSSMKTF
jgi:hypothetical protein